MESSSSPRVIRFDQILPLDCTRAVYDNAVMCFLSLHTSWESCPRFHREISEWLVVYQGVWVCRFAGARLLLVY